MNVLLPTADIYTHSLPLTMNYEQLAQDTRTCAHRQCMRKDCKLRWTWTSSCYTYSDQTEAAIYKQN